MQQYLGESDKTTADSYHIRLIQWSVSKLLRLSFYFRNNMNITKFNAANLKRFQYVEVDPYTRDSGQHVRRFVLHQHCPILDKYCRMLVPGNWNVNFKSDDGKPVDDDTCVISQHRIDNLENRPYGSRPKHIIMCREKHFTYYYDAPDTETIGRTAIHILKKRAEGSCYYALSQHSIDRENEIPSEPTQKPEDFPNDPEFANLATTKWGQYNREYKARKEEKDFRTHYARAMKTDYTLAVELLQERNDYEYEGFEFESLTKIER